MNTLKQQIKESKQILKQEMEKLFTQISADLFIQYPDLASFSWTQYTPYFNDGDECKFSANHEMLDIRFHNIDLNLEDYSYSLKSAYDKIKEEQSGAPLNKYVIEYLKKYSAEIEKVRPLMPILEKVYDFMSNFEDEDLKELFGDHCLVTVTKEGTSTQEYSHD